MPPLPRPSSVTVERDGHLVSAQRRVLPADVVTAVRELQGGRDITVSVEPEGLEERLVLAVEGSRGFLGLERPDGRFQFCPADPAAASHQFLIGGQPTNIEAKYVVELSTAADVVDEWLALGEASSAGSWERQ